MINSRRRFKEYPKLKSISSSRGRSGALDIRGDGVIIVASGGVSGHTMPTHVGLWSVIRVSKGFVRPPIELR